MQVVILAGGLGTRLSEETDQLPKPMVRIGGVPILVHIMQIYAFYGHTDFVISTGYKANVIDEFFETKKAVIRKHRWNVETVNTGIDTGTGGRLLGLEAVLDKTFFMTYGDGLSSVRIDKLLEFHQSMGLQSTVTAVRPPARFGSIQVEDNLVVDFREKDSQDVGWINGGFFVLNQEVLSSIPTASVSFESSALTSLTRDRNLACYKHADFWQPMDTLRDKRVLEELYVTEPQLWIKNLGAIHDFC